jgi:hypothetical protein
MYPWSERAVAPEEDAPGRCEESEMTAALQLALDRRDNGGDAVRRLPQ